MTTAFEQIIKANYPGELTDMEPSDNMPAVTPGEGGVFGLATLLVITGLTAHFSEHVQLACIAGGVLLGCVGGLTHAKIRVARNDASAMKAVAQSEVEQAHAYAASDTEES